MRKLEKEIEEYLILYLLYFLLAVGLCWNVSVKELSQGPGTHTSFKSVLTLRHGFLHLREWCGDITEHLHWDSHTLRDFLGEYET